MELEQAREFVRRHHHAVLATRSETDGIQQTPVLLAVDEHGRFVISSRETAFKTKNLRRDPRAHLCVLRDKFFGEWIYVEGTADVLSLPEAMEPLVDYYRLLAGEHSDWDDYRRSMQREQRVLIRIDATRAGPDRKG
jgi:PPOX class probable F420-dependent enzyme